MAAFLPQDGDPSDPDKPGPSSGSHFLKQQAGGTQGSGLSSSATSADIKRRGDKAYDEVANYDEEELRSLLEEVTNAGKRENKSTLSPYALALLLKEQDALREESSSGDDTRDLAYRRRSKKSLVGRRDQASGDQQSAAARTSTGGSLGSLHDLSETKQPKKVAGPNQGVASRCREGGSCGNLSRGSFETQPPVKRKGRRSKDAARASASQREGGSLQNLSKTEAASNESKKLHKSGSLSQVCSEVAGGARSKVSSHDSGRLDRLECRQDDIWSAIERIGFYIFSTYNRRPKTASESSSCRYSRRSEDREGGEESSGDEAVGENRSRLLAQSPRSAEHTFPPEGVGGATGGIGPDCSNDIDDSMSDVASEGETTEEEVEPLRSLVSRNCSDDPIEENGIELQTVTCHRADFDIAHTEVDKRINFSLGRPQVENMLNSCTRRSLPLQNSQCVTSVFKEEKSGNKGSEEESVGKRKLLASRHDGCIENKSSLDENGNPVMPSSSSSILTSVSSSERHNTLSMQTHSTSRRSVMSSSLKDSTRFDRVKARNDKKKANKEKDVVNIKETPGFRGDQALDDLLKFIEPEADSSNVKNKRKHKGKKDDSREDREGPKRRNRNPDRACEDDEGRCRGGGEEGRCRAGEEGGGGGGGAVVIEVGRDGSRRSREKEDDRRANNNYDKKNKNDAKKGKKGSGSLRESSSVEDLVSKSKQSDGVRDLRKRVTVDDGDMSLSVLNAYREEEEANDENGPFGGGGGGGVESGLVDVAVADNELDLYQMTSEFRAEFYNAGEAFQAPDILDFEVVSNKKRSRRYKNNGSQTSSQSSRSGGSDRPACEEGLRYPRFGQGRLGPRPGGGGEQPRISFAEGPRTAHEDAFLAQWSQLGVGDRYGAERYSGTTTSAPHSEDSGSDGDDSVHSMPVPSTTPRPDVRKPPPSSDSTPQASYANIAKLAASANRAQIKRMSALGGQPGGGAAFRESEGEPGEGAEASDARTPAPSEPRPANILDDNFPSLAESLGGIGPQGVTCGPKLSDPRANHDGPAIEAANPRPASSPDEGREASVVNEVNCGQREASDCSPPVDEAEGETSERRQVRGQNDLSANPPQQQQQVPQLQDHLHQVPPPSLHMQHLQHPHNNPQHLYQQSKQQSVHYQQTNPHQYTPHQPVQQRPNPHPHTGQNHPSYHPQQAPPYHPQQAPPYHPQQIPPPPQTGRLKQSPFTQPPPPLPQQTKQPHHSLPPQPNPHPPSGVQPQQPHPHAQPNSHPQGNPHSQPSPQSKSPHSLQQGHPPNPHPHTQNHHPLSHPQQNAHPQNPHPNCQPNPHSQPNPHLQPHSHANPHPHPHAQASSSPQPNSYPQSASPHQQSLHSQPSPQPSPQPQQGPQEDSPPQHHEQNSQPELNAPFDQSSALLLCSANGLGDASEDRQSLRQTKNEPAAPGVQLGDTSRVKRMEPAVVFTDNAKFNHSVSGIEFGFGFDESIVTSDNDLSGSENYFLENEDNNCNVNNNHIKNSLAVTKDFSKWFKAPKNDKISYNYEELIRHVSKAWEVTLQLMEEDPKNIQYWRAAGSTEGT